MRTLLAASIVVLAAACSREKTSSPQSSPASPGDDAGAPAAAAVAAPATSAPAGPPLPSLDGFQGEIDLVVKDSEAGAKATPFVVLVKDGKVRFDLPDAVAQAGVHMVGPKPYVVLEPSAKKLAVISDERRQALLVDMNDTDALRGFHGGGAAAHHGSGPPKGAARVTQTGKLDVVAGTRCEEWEVTTDHRDSSLCVAEQDASFLHLPSTGLPDERLWLLQVMDGRHVPLRMITYRKDGQTEVSRIEVTGMEKRELSPGAFEYPASYHVMDMAQMMRGMMGMASAMPAFVAPPAGKAH